MLAGAILLLGPVLLRLRFGVDEVVTTLLLNFIVLLFVSMMIEGPLKDPMAFGWPQSWRCRTPFHAGQAGAAHAPPHRACLARSRSRRVVVGSVRHARRSA